MRPPEVTDGSPLLGEPILQAEKLLWQPQGGGFTLEVPSLLLHRGDCLGVIGPSGCGKSTLLGLLSLALPPSSVQRFTLLGQELTSCFASGGQKTSRLDEQFFTQLRARHIGFIPQTAGLIPFLTARENIVLALQVLGQKPSRYDINHIHNLAERLEITACLDKLPSHLSVGQNQRVAIARALVHAPPILLADEPTAPLHPSQAANVLRLLHSYAKEQKAAVITVSHDVAALEHAEFEILPAEMKSNSTLICN